MIEMIKNLLAFKQMGNTKNTAILRGMYKVPTSFREAMNQIKLRRYVN